MAMTDEEFCVQFSNDVLAYARSGNKPSPTQAMIDLAEGYLKLSELQRWRKFPDERPEESGIFHTYELTEEDFVRDEDDRSSLYRADFWDAEKQEWNMGNEPAIYWRPIGPTPVELYLPEQLKQGSLFQ